jgi:hypothetical protein
MTCSFAFSKHRLSGLGPCWVRDGVGVGRLAPLGELLELVREQVPVAVQRHGRRGVAELGLDRLDAGAMGDEKARAGVAKVMEPQPMGESGPDHCRLEDYRCAAARMVRMRSRWSTLGPHGIGSCWSTAGTSGHGRYATIPGRGAFTSRTS